MRRWVKRRRACDGARAKPLREAEHGAFVRSRVQLTGGVLAERAQAAGDLETLHAQALRLASRDPEAPHGAGVEVADEVATALRGPRLAAVDMATGDEQVAAVKAWLPTVSQSATYVSGGPDGGGFALLALAPASATTMTSRATATERCPLDRSVMACPELFRISLSLPLMPLVLGSGCTGLLVGTAWVGRARPANRRERSTT